MDYYLHLWRIAFAEKDSSCFLNCIITKLAKNNKREVECKRCEFRPTRLFIDTSKLTRLKSDYFDINKSISISPTNRKIYCRSSPILNSRIKLNKIILKIENHSREKLSQANTDRHLGDHVFSDSWLTRPKNFRKGYFYFLR